MSLFLAGWHRRADWLFDLVGYFRPIPWKYYYVIIPCHYVITRYFVSLRKYYVLNNDSPQWHAHVVDIYALSVGSCDLGYRFHGWSILVYRKKLFVSSNFRQLLVILGEHRLVVELGCLLCPQPSTKNSHKSHVKILSGTVHLRKHPRIYNSKLYLHFCTFGENYMLRIMLNDFRSPTIWAIRFLGFWK